MANFTPYRVTLGLSDYPAKYDAYVLAVEAFATEIENAREGQANLLANNLRYIKATVGLTQGLAANGFRFTGLPSPLAANEAATKGYADGLSFASSLPSQVGNAGLEITTNGTTGSWGLSGPGALAILNFIGY